MHPLESYVEDTLRRVVREEVRRAIHETARSAGPSDDRVTRTKAAAAASVSPATISKWVGEGRLRAYGEGRNTRFSLAEVLAMKPPEMSSAETVTARAVALFEKHHG